ETIPPRTVIPRSLSSANSAGTTCVISAARRAYFPERVESAALWTYSNVEAHARLRGARSRLLRVLLTQRGRIVTKIVIVVGATLAMVVAASAADLPRRQPVYQTASVGKMPIGKTPIGKTPIGKTPVAARY